MSRRASVQRPPDFTAWCSPEIDAKARATGKPLPGLHKRLEEALDAALGPVEWVATVEEEKTKDGKLLLHVQVAGAFGDLTRSRRDKIAEATWRALADWKGSGARCHVKLKIAQDTGWGSYVTKRAWLARPYIRERFACAGPRSPWRLSFDGPAFTMTNGARARAKELHRQARDLDIEARERARALAEPSPPNPRRPSLGLSGRRAGRSAFIENRPVSHRPYRHALRRPRPSGPGR